MLSKRLARLEAKRPAPGDQKPLDMEALPRDVAARIMAALAEGAFPQRLFDADLQATATHTVAGRREATFVRFGSLWRNFPRGALQSR